MLQYQHGGAIRCRCMDMSPSKLKLSIVSEDRRSTTRNFDNNFQFSLPTAGFIITSQRPWCTRCRVCQWRSGANSRGKAVELLVDMCRWEHAQGLLHRYGHTDKD